MMDISWANGATKTSYIAHIRIECQDRVGMLRDVLMKTGDLS
jgi:(p)ppGpp synthase/HD superfamily hydrolase